MNESDISSKRLRRLDADWSEEAGRVVIQKRKFGRFGTAFLRLFRISPFLTLRLDAVGSEIWRELDGKTAGELLAQLEATMPGEQDLPIRLGRYLSTLATNQLIAIE